MQNENSVFQAHSNSISDTDIDTMHNVGTFEELEQMNLDRQRYKTVGTTEFRPLTKGCGKRKTKSHDLVILGTVPINQSSSAASR